MAFSWLHQFSFIQPFLPSQKWPIISVIPSLSQEITMKTALGHYHKDFSASQVSFLLNNPIFFNLKQTSSGTIFIFIWSHQLTLFGFLSELSSSFLCEQERPETCYLRLLDPFFCPTVTFWAFEHTHHLFYSHLQGSFITFTEPLNVFPSLFHSILLMALPSYNFKG